MASWCRWRSTRSAWRTRWKRRGCANGPHRRPPPSGHAVNLKPRRHEEPEINVVSLIDVVLLLVVFFILSSRFSDEGRLRVHLPHASAVPAEKVSGEPLVVSVTQQGGYLVNGHELINSSPETLRAALLKEAGTFTHQDPRTIVWVPLALIGLFILRGLGDFTQTYFMGYVGRRIVSQLRREVFRHILHLPIGYFDRSSSAALLSRLIYNTEQIGQATTDSV